MTDSLLKAAKTRFLRLLQRNCLTGGSYRRQKRPTISTAWSWVSHWR